MAHVLVIGGGLSGCTAALELAKSNHRVTIVEKADSIGGKVRQFGCKSAESCNNCGLCLAGGLWEQVEKSDSIEILTLSRLADVTGPKGNFKVTVKDKEGYKTLSEISSIIVSIGFERATSESFGNLEIASEKSIISGFELEKYISQRNREGVMPEVPSRIAFIQCFGSRDIQEKALYCSKFCCGYSTRAAKVLKQYYKDAEITFFYMDLQYVKEGQYLEELTQAGFEFIKCRPTKVKDGKPAKVFYEQPETGTVIEREFDLIVLSEGAHSPSDAEAIAELCTLRVDDKGFLCCVKDGSKTGVYVCGCASGPKRIEEVYSESIAVAKQLMSNMS